MGGGILYNTKIYEELGLSVPKSWDEFMANNDKIKAAGKVAVIQTYGDTWTSQLFVLADYYNVQAEVPDFADKYTANKAKYATTPAALQRLRAAGGDFKAGYFNEDFGAAKYDDGLRMVADRRSRALPDADLRHRRASSRTTPTTSTTSASSPSRATTPRRTASPSGCRRPSTSRTTASMSRRPRTS